MSKLNIGDHFSYKRPGMQFEAILIKKYPYEFKPGEHTYEERITKATNCPWEKGAVITSSSTEDEWIKIIMPAKPPKMGRETITTKTGTKLKWEIKKKI